MELRIRKINQCLTHLNDSHLGKIINGKTKNPGIDYLLAIAEALELTNDEFAELCGYSKEKKINN